MRIALGYHVLVIISMFFQNTVAKIPANLVQESIKLSADHAPANMIMLEGSMKETFEADPSAQTYWLPITVNNNQEYVLVNLYQHAYKQRPKIDPETGKSNFYFCDTILDEKTGSPRGLPRGLYHWKGDEAETARHRPKLLRYHYNKESGMYKRRGTRPIFWKPYPKDEPFIINQLKKLAQH